MFRLFKTVVLIFSCFLLFSCATKPLSTEEKSLPIGQIENVLVEQDVITFDVNVSDTDTVMLDGTLKVVLYKTEEVVSELLLDELVNSDLEFTNLLLNSEYIIKLQAKYDLDNGDGDKNIVLATITFTTESLTILCENEINSTGNYTLIGNSIFNKYSLDNGNTWRTVEETKIVELQLDEGNYKIKIMNSSGEISESVSLVVDMTTPIITTLRYDVRDIKITAPAQYGWFGNSVAIEENYVIVGAYLDNNGRGSIYVYDLNKEENEEGYETKIIASDGKIYDSFGYSVSISGNYIVVGAPGDEENIIGSIYVYDLTKGKNEEGYERKITASDGEVDNRFGYSVAIEGNYVIVGAYGDNYDRGSIYVYDLTKGENEEGYERKITASVGELYGRFGYSVAIEGNYVVVGAYEDNNHRGSIYVYDLTKGENEEGYERKITASDGVEADYFGNSVAIEGNYVVVGAYGDDDFRGSTYVYDLTKEENEEGYERKITASDGAESDYFGISVAISENQVVVGAYEDNNQRGSTYMYDLTRDKSEEEYENKILAFDVEVTDLFGRSVAIEGNHVVVGQRETIYVYINKPYYKIDIDDQSGIDLIELTKDGIQITKPQCFILSEEGTYSIKVIDNAGNEALYNFELEFTKPILRGENNAINDTGDYNIIANEAFNEYSIDNGTTWVSVESTFTYHLTDLSDGIYNLVIKDMYGNKSDSINLIIDKTPPIITSTRYDVSYILEKITTSDGEVFDSFGYSVATSGNYVVIGAQEDNDNGNSSGSIYVYDLTKELGEEGYERKITASDGEAYDGFGTSVAIFENYVVVGVPYDYNTGIRSGSIYVYDLTKEESEEGYERKITASDGEEGNWFGYSVAISENYIVVGARYDDENGVNSGSIYVYDLTKGENGEGYERKIKASDGEAQDLFGMVVAISGNNVVVGVNQDNDNGTESGSIYVYDLTKGENEEGYERKITASDGEEYDHFGSSVAIEGNYIVVGACSDDRVRGSIYVYDLTKEEIEEGYERKIIASDGENYDSFGNNVSISGNYVVVGTRWEYNNGEGSSSIYVYDLTKGENEEGYERKITANEDKVYDGFGYNVAISENYIVVGAFGNLEEEISGSIYVYLNRPHYQIDIDDLSGIYSIEVTKDGNDINLPARFILTEEGIYSIMVIDNAGNKTIYDFEVEFTKPIIISENNMINNTGSYTIISNEAFNQYSIDNGITWVSIESTLSYHLSDLSDGVYKIIIKDISGNQSENVALIIDKISPVITSIKYDVSDLLVKK